MHSLIPALLLVALMSAFSASTEPVYIGTYTGGASEGIYLLQFDADSGALTLEGLAAETENPSFLAVHPHKPFIYAAGESGAGDEIPGGAVSAFAIQPDTGLLTLLNRQASQGGGACHVSVSPSGAHVAVANYGSGGIALLPVNDDGSLAPASAFHQHEGSSVNPKRQEGPHAHSVNFDAAGRFLFAADLGTDSIQVYAYDAAAGTLTPAGSATLAPGAGPRHFVFHPSGKFAWVVNEMGNTITAFAYADGALTEVQTVPTLPADFEGESSTAEIRVHPSGRFLYASNRGHDSIAAFAIDEATGLLTPLCHTPTGGKTPRNFALNPTGQWLLAANQESDSVVVFRVKDDGRLEANGDQVEVPAPVCVLFAGRASK
jgi:6-phosphogluconolactonase